MMVRQFLKLTLPLFLMCVTMSKLLAYYVPSSGNSSITTCSGTVTDHGGTSYYSNNANGTLTINPGTSGSKVKLTFSSFSTESGFDKLYVYNGTSTSASLIGTYSGSSLPSAITATGTTGALTLKFVSDYSTTRAGFQASISCVSGGTDVTVVSTSLSSTTITQGGAISVSGSLKNSGSTHISGYTYLGYYLSKDSVFDVGDTYLTNDYNTYMYAGSSYYESASMTIPSSMPVGDYYILFVADYNNLHNESDEMNNVVAEPFSIEKAYVDITVVTTSLSSTTVGQGNSITASGYLKNLGNSSVSTITYLGYYLSKDAKISSDDLLLATDYTSSMYAGSSYDESASLTIPDTTLPGSYYVLFVGDYNNLHTESNEVNNIVASSLTIEETYIDVSVVSSSLAWSNKVGQGNPIMAYSSLKNSGTRSMGGTYLGYYLSSDAKFDSNDQLLATDYASLVNVGGKYSQNASLTIPESTVPGSYYILFVGDYNNLHTESNESNNVEAVPVTVEETYKNITVVSASLSMSKVAKGYSVTAYGALKNIGTANISTTTHLGYYLSTDAILDTGDKLLTTDSNPGMIVGSSHSESATLTIPSSTAPGDYYILFVGDYNNLHTESNESDNGVAVPLKVELAYRDVTVVSTSLSANSVTQGGFVTAYGSMKNEGNIAISGYTNLGYYLSRDSLFDGSDVLLATDYNSSMAVGGAVSESATLTIPSTTVLGDYYILFVGDYDNQQTESNEDNNVSTVPLTVEQSKRDVSLKNVYISGSTEVYSGGYLYAYATLVNSGNVSLSSYIHLGYYFSTDSTWDSSDELLDTDYDYSMSVGGSSSESTTLYVPSGTSAGTYYIIFKADYTNRWTESDENNNYKSIPIVVKAKDIDLSIDASVTSNQIEQGGVLSINYTLENLGTYTSSSSYVGFYISENQVWDDADYYIGSEYESSMYGGEKTTGNFNKSFTASLSDGIYYLLVVADHGEKVSEVNEANNVKAILIYVGEAEVRELEPSLESASSLVVFNGLLECKGEISNPGNISSGSFNVRYYLSNNSQFDLLDEELSQQNLSSISGQGSSTFSFNYRMTDEYEEGDYYLFIVVDEDDLVNENNENNNILSFPFKLRQLRPDLTIQGVRTEGFYYAGQTIDYEVEIGSFLTATSTVKFAVYLSKNSTLDASDLRFHTEDVEPFYTPSGVKTLSGSFQLPSSTSGSNYLIYVIDDEDDMVELDEWNNQFKIYFANGKPLGDDDPSQWEISMFPNPASSMVQFELNHGFDRVEVINVSGMVVKQEAFGESFGSMDVTDLPEGTYFVRFSNLEGHSTVKKMVVRR